MIPRFHSMRWTDRIRHVKILLLVVAVIIAVASLLVSHSLTSDLAKEERSRMEVWAQAMKSLNTADDNTDLGLVLKVINENNTIPVVVLDSKGNAQLFRNLHVEGDNYQDSLSMATRIGRDLLLEGKAIKIEYNNEQCDYVQVCYDDSLMLRRLMAYPLVQTLVVLVFVFIALFALLVFKRAEQNRVWVGLSKETAHQLGTPISSLMAWIEVMKETYPDDALLPEMNKDVERLRLIAERFSKIGSVPELSPVSLGSVINHVADYMDKRTSQNIQIKTVFPDDFIDVVVPVNEALFEWVIENLVKNAVDAMSASGGLVQMEISLHQNFVYLDVSDTGKGIRKKDLKNVFRPGFTTKKRGWGLGLSLAKRIVEEYHHGKLWVKYSELGKGTTFRIELKRE